MKEKEVYVVIVDHTYDLNKHVSCNVFENKENALAELERLKLNKLVVEEWEDGFSCYIDGDYVFNHYDVQIHRKQIN